MLDKDWTSKNDQEITGRYGFQAKRKNKSPRVG